MKYIYRLIFIIHVFAFQLANADENYLCTYGSKEREISLVYQKLGKPLPCEVRYKKDGLTEVLWSSTNTQGFCEEKAQSFLQQQIDWGWRCSNISPTATLSQPKLGGYEKDAAFVQIISLISGFKMRVVDYHANVGKYPGDLESLGIDPADMKDSSHFSELTIGASGTIYVKGNKELGEELVISLAPKNTLGGIATEWTCTTNIKLTGTRYCEYNADLKYPKN